MCFIVIWNLIQWRLPIEDAIVISATVKTIPIDFLFQRFQTSGRIYNFLKPSKRDEFSEFIVCFGRRVHCQNCFGYFSVAFITPGRILTLELGCVRILSVSSHVRHSRVAGVSSRITLVPDALPPQPAVLQYTFWNNSLVFSKWVINYTNWIKPVRLAKGRQPTKHNFKLHKMVNLAKLKNTLQWRCLFMNNVKMYRILNCCYLPPPFAFALSSDQKAVLKDRRVKTNNATNNASATIGAKCVLNATMSMCLVHCRVKLFVFFWKIMPNSIQFQHNSMMSEIISSEYGFADVQSCTMLNGFWQMIVIVCLKWMDSNQSTYSRFHHSKAYTVKHAFTHINSAVIYVEPYHSIVHLMAFNCLSHSGADPEFLLGGGAKTLPQASTQYINTFSEKPHEIEKSLVRRQRPLRSATHTEKITIREWFHGDSTLFHPKAV